MHPAEMARMRSAGVTFTTVPTVVAWSTQAALVSWYGNAFAHEPFPSTR